MFDYIKKLSFNEKDVRMMNPLVWAYIGDSVYEVYVRSYIISKGGKTSFALHRESIKYVKASSQSDILETIYDKLTEEEKNIIRRGRNTKTYHVPKNASIIDYKRATALEALIGYLYLLKRYDRIDEIMNMILEGAK
ncbi:Mini-ribonuclease 3 [Caloramator sp. E03]|uniref:Mini-ribonuclease 3 n=1 Tax=Caloramator sp. E03 TaxID=2576307 RepID=UPI0011105B3E|nr:ribonuclease III domain-containing protein [Caloramator sp. E03]QCX33814.1 Mini-ribonuclease 3 [Caloramator sp. E03]